MVGSHNLEELAEGLPNQVYPVFDLYGKCERITILSGQDAGRSSSPVPEEISIFEQMLSNASDQNASVPECEKADLETHEKWLTKERPSTSKSKAITTTIGGTTINLTLLLVYYYLYLIQKLFFLLYFFLFTFYLILKESINKGNLFT